MSSAHCSFIVLLQGILLHTNTHWCCGMLFLLVPHLVQRHFNMRTARSGNWTNDPPISGWPTLPPEALLLVRKIKNFRLKHTNLWRWKAEDSMQKAPVFTWMFCFFLLTVVVCMSRGNHTPHLCFLPSALENKTLKGTLSHSSLWEFFEVPLFQRDELSSMKHFFLHRWQIPTIVYLVY